MSTKQNLTTTNARIDALEAAMTSGFAAVIAALDGTTPTAPVVTAPKAEAKPAKAKARKTVARKPVPNGAVEGHKCLTRKNRDQFVADHAWAKALPVAQRGTFSLVQAVIDGAPLVGVWAIGADYVAKATGGVAEGTVIVAGPKGNVFLGSNTPEVTPEPEVEADAPEWGTPEWIAATHPREAGTPRNAKGQPTPKREWLKRCALEATGKFDRDEIDAIVALG